VLTNSGTQVAVTAAPDPVRPGQFVQYAVTVTNRSTGNNFYSVEALTPNGTTVSGGAIGQGGGCNGIPLLNTVCGPGGVIGWFNVLIVPGQSATFTFAALVDTANAPPNGTVIRSTATALVINGIASGATAGVDVVVSP